MKELTVEECMEIFKKYDKGLYEYYKNNMHLFGWNARNYAKYLIAAVKRRDIRWNCITNKFEWFTGKG